MSDLAEQKAAARAAGYARRKLAHGAGGADIAQARLLEFLAPHMGKAIAGYMPINTEIDPLPVMARLVQSGPVAVPVIEGAGRPLKFRQWTPDCAMKAGPFGAQVPVSGAWIRPEVLIVPLVAFDRAGMRLGYGGGYYDRTLDLLRQRHASLAVGFAYGGQETDDLPQEQTDQRLDAMVTPWETIVFT